MLRKLNFTERIRLPRRAVEITLRREGNELAFDAVLAIDDRRLPLDARVFVQAHYRQSFMRFDFGTVGVVTPPEDRRLTAIDSDNVASFVVKVVGAGGRILAQSRSLTLSERRDGAAGRESLLPVDFRDLDEEVWRVWIDETSGPVLCLNSSIDGIDRLARDDASFFGLVYPAAVREVLTHALLAGEPPEDEPDDWRALWIRWAEELSGTPLPSDDDPLARRDWVDDVSAAFARRHRVVSRLTSSSGEPAP